MITNQRVVAMMDNIKSSCEQAIKENFLNKPRDFDGLEFWLQSKSLKYERNKKHIRVFLSEQRVSEFSDVIKTDYVDIEYGETVSCTFQMVVKPEYEKTIHDITQFLLGIGE